MRVLVFGAGGQLGGELVRVCRAQGDEVTALTRREVDLADVAHVHDRVVEGRPGVVFNAAAYSAVDRAEEDIAGANLVNAIAPRAIAAAAAEAGAPLVHFSTDYVFDGTATVPIAEDVEPNPLGVYGETKLVGEREVLESGASAYVVRTSWLYGGAGPNFPLTVLRLAREKGEMRIVDDQRGSPTWARDLAVAARRLVDVGDPGVYHLSNSGDCTWYELARAVVEERGLDATVHPIPTSEYPTPARRPAYSVLANSRWQALGEPPLRPWREALHDYVAELADG
ncbi:MAG: dTDP-4-dehydrorhamnose reductase [Chloroflexota bacterium]|jgi:dTDP-4-dehydrorhamnose reductase|nr:dTDP-4-dehydrorhamnose reductase [Chloroflexota bacterium]